jgi:SAM-dependent methyltransferase
MGILGSGGRWIGARVVGDVLAIGGHGETMSLLSREGHKVVEVDVEQGGELAFEDGSFDTVVLGDSLVGLLSRERPLAEAGRVLRPEGRLIVSVPYGGEGSEEARLSLGELLTDLSSFSVKEIETVEGRLCVLAERAPGKSRVEIWRRALDVAERRLAQREEEVAKLGASIAALEARRENEERALADVRGDVERLETALAAANHRRDSEKEAARLARDGVSVLERRLEVELAQARTRLEAREEELRRTVAVSDERQRELTTLRERLRSAEARDERLSAAESELPRLRTALAESERKLDLTEARLEKSQQRAARFQASLLALREGRAYRLTRVLWRLRRPFRRTRQASAERPAGGEEESAPSPPSGAHGQAPTPRTGTVRAKPAPKRPPRVLPPGGRLRVAAILDEMSAACFAPECDLIPLTLESWREQLDDRDPDLLLVESAWNGNDGEWQYRIAKYPRKDLLGLPALRTLLDGCRERGIPTAFWNKEDPVHFDRFAEAASLFDHVFTTDGNCVERYRALPGERTVAVLPFAAQPRIHNPTAVVDERSASPCFAGAWYRDRHPDRRRSLEALLDAARPHGLVIYDRRFGGDDGVFGFPERFQPHVLGHLPYERVLDVYKSHRVFLNANSVAGSPTMCSRRVFELAACDTPILSTPATALPALFGDDSVVEAADEASAADALERLLGDEGERSRRARAARRTVFAEHTYAERLATIAEATGLDASGLRRAPFVAPSAGSNGGGGPPSAAANDLPWTLLVGPDVELSEPALADLAAATAFADADVIGASPSRDGDRAMEHRYVTDLDPRALLLRSELVEARGRPNGSPEEVRARLREWSDDGVRLYAADADLVS